MNQQNIIRFNVFLNDFHIDEGFQFHVENVKNIKFEGSPQKTPGKVNFFKMSLFFLN